MSDAERGSVEPSATQLLYDAFEAASVAADFHWIKMRSPADVERRDRAREARDIAFAKVRAAIARLESSASPTPEMVTVDHDQWLAFERWRDGSTVGLLTALVAEWKDLVFDIGNALGCLASTSPDNNGHIIAKAKSLAASSPAPSPRADGVTDDDLRRAIRLWNDWPADFPIDDLWIRHDVNAVRMRRVLASLPLYAGSAPASEVPTDDVSMRV